MHPEDQELLLDSVDACEEDTAQSLELEWGIRAELESLTLRALNRWKGCPIYGPLEVAGLAEGLGLQN